MVHHDATVEQATYRITVGGTLDACWSDWFSGLALTTDAGQQGLPATILTGRIDQAALRGILNRCWDLNLTVLSVTTLPPTEAQRVSHDPTARSGPDDNPTDSHVPSRTER